MADWKSGGNAKKPGWRGDGEAARRTARHSWKAGEAAPPGTGRRKLAAAVVGLLLVGVAVAIVVVFLLPKPAPTPCLVLFANNPADTCTRLDIPQDLYGWQSAKLLAEQAKERAGREGNFAPHLDTAADGSPLPLPPNKEGLETWANSVRSFDPLVIYVGTHAGTQPEGPFLFASGGARLPVTALLEVLGSPELAGKKKVLLLDPGRMPASAVTGQIYDDFAAKVKALNKEIAAVPNLLVILGADAGQRGWEIEERQATPLAIAVSEALNGAGNVSGSNDLITGQKFFESVQKRVGDWTRENRPAACTPILLPEGAEGESRAAAITVAVKPSTPAVEKAPVTNLDYDELKRAWSKHDELAKAVPAPHVYSPRLWRRYRELLLRYENALRSGEAGTAKKLRSALDASEEMFEARKLPPFESVVNSIAFRQARGLPAAEIEDALRSVVADGGLTESNFAALRKIEPDQRPIEAHLPVMVEEFYRNVAKDAKGPPAAWGKSIALRRAAERLTFGLPLGEPVANLHHYSEMPGSYIQGRLRDDDKRRRDVEDRLFSNAPDALNSIAESATAIEDHQKQIEENITLRNRGLTLRDAALADLPYLSLWLLTRGLSDADFKDQIALWRNLHTFNEKFEPRAGAFINNDDELLRDLIPWLNEALNAAKARFVAAVAEQDANTTLQGQWLAKQNLLAVPLIPAEKRLAILKLQRTPRTDKSKEPQAKGLEGDERIRNRTLQAVRFGRLALAILGIQEEANLPAAATIEAPFAQVEAAPARSDLLLDAGEMLAKHYRHRAVIAVPSANLDPTETASRVSIAFTADEALEPAAANCRLRWNKFLLDLAARTAEDRWYDERGLPYFQKAAERYFHDADKVIADIPAIKTSADELEKRKKLLADRKLLIHPAPGIPEPMQWTSERRRLVQFEIVVPKDYPIAMGHAVAVRDFEKIAPLKPSDAALAGVRPLIAIMPGQSSPLDISLDIAGEKSFQAQCSSAAVVWFRGQRPRSDFAIAVNRKPELVFAEPLPRDGEKDVKVAVRAAPDLDLGEIVIIIDYSGSMKWSIVDNTDYTENKAYRTKPDAKFFIAMNALKKVLADLPKGTRLKIRIFSDQNPEGKEKDRLIESNALKDGRVSWSKEDPLPLNALIENLSGIEPFYETPLINTMVKAKGDFTNDKSRTKTMIVLTDGVDSAIDADPKIPNDPKVEKNMPGLMKTLDDNFRDSGISLFVVQFSKVPEEKKLIKRLFKDVEAYRDNPGQVWNAQDSASLDNALRDALRPKLKLTDASTGGTPKNFPVSGLPSRMLDAERDSRETLVWSPLLKVPANQRFLAAPYPSADRIERELRVDDGDRILLELAKVDDRTILRRGLYADFFAEEKKKARGDRQWMLTVPTMAVNDSTVPLALRGLMFLEKVPPNRVGVSEPATILQQSRPEFLWWDVAPVLDGKPVLGTLTVKKLYGYAAPAWEFSAEDWPHDPANAMEFAKARITAYASDRRPLSRIITVGKSDSAKKETTEDGDEVELRPAFESHPIGPNGEEIPCLVIRVTHKPGKPVLLRLVDPAVKHNAEHRYYKKADGYTAIFGPFTEADFRSQPAKLELIAASPVIADAAAAIVLTPPRPSTRVLDEQTYKP